LAPGADHPLGRSGNRPRSVGRHAGADPRPVVPEVTGGRLPQRSPSLARAGCVAAVLVRRSSGHAG